MRTIQDLQYFQAMPLDVKIGLTKNRLREWVNHYGLDGVYISFSGGKDSTVLLDIARKMYGNDIKAMFVDVPTQYPELKQFAMSFDNVDITSPKISFAEVCEKYGFPLISKEVAQTVYEVQKAKSKGKEPASYRMRKLNGEAIDKKTGKKSSYNMTKWKFLIESPFFVSHQCCNTMKKNPAHVYHRQTDRQCISAEMAQESRLRKQKWLEHGCNGFDLKIPKSTPMSFWTEQDVLKYIKINNLPICSVYGEVVEDLSNTEEVAGQLTISDLKGYENEKGFDAPRLPLKTTGCSRTGCVLCGFGCHLEKPEESRFVKLKKSHPQLYRLLDLIKNNGYTMREAIEWINENGNGVHIEL